MQIIKNSFLVVGLMLVLAVSNLVFAERYVDVTINNQRLNSYEVQSIESELCIYIPNGNYWLDINTGLWGYMGSYAPMGYLTNNCNNNSSGKSLSERGLLYNSWDHWGIAVY